MKISALIPTYNRRAYVIRAIESVLSQSVPPDEVIVVDDGSKDDTVEQVEARFGSKVRVVRQENRGVSGARLRAIKEARGEWIAFLDSDDEWSPGRQAYLLDTIKKLPPEVAWLFGDMQVRTDEGEQLTLFQEHGLTVTGEPQVFDDSFSVQYPFQFPMLQASLIRREALLEGRCFEDGFRSDDDLLAGFQIASKHKFAAVPKVVTVLSRTSDLFATSVLANGLKGPDYYRSRMRAFSLAMLTTGKRIPWAVEYEQVVRGLCKFYAAQGKSVRALALEQFRFAVSTRSVAFMAAAMLGRPGLRMWQSAGSVAGRSAN